MRRRMNEIGRGKGERLTAMGGPGDHPGMARKAAAGPMDAGSLVVATTSTTILSSSSDTAAVAGVAAPRAASTRHACALERVLSTPSVALRLGRGEGDFVLPCLGCWSCLGCGGGTRKAPNLRAARTWLLKSVGSTSGPHERRVCR